MMLKDQKSCFSKKKTRKLIYLTKEVIFLNARFNLPFAFYLFEKTKNSYLFKDIW